MATSGRAKIAIITGWIYYPEFLFKEKSNFLYKSGHINRLDILAVDILSGVYCSWALRVKSLRHQLITHLGPNLLVLINWAY